MCKHEEVNDIDAKEKGFWKEVEVSVDLNKPVEQDFLHWPHMFYWLVEV